MPSQRPQTLQASRSIQAASRGSGLPGNAGVTDNLPMARTCCLLQRIKARGVDFLARTKAQRANIPASFASDTSGAVTCSIFFLPERAPPGDGKVKLTALYMRHSDANFHFNTSGAHSTPAREDAALTSRPSSGEAHVPPTRVRLAPSFTTKGEKARQPTPRCSSSCVVETSREKSQGVVSVSGRFGQPVIAAFRLGESPQFGSPSFQYSAHEGLKRSIGALHSSIPMQLLETSSLEAL